MIRQLSGTIVSIGPTFIVLDVVGIGYIIHTDSPISHQLDTTAIFHTHLVVRENALDLYGFLERDTLEMFELLIGLPKIGPKTALQILTVADSKLLKESASNDDPSYLSKLSGIGKKSAEKIVLGLKDKLDKNGYGDFSPVSSSSPSYTHTADTIEALIALGYPAIDARRIVSEISDKNPSINSSAEVIKLALKKL